MREESLKKVVHRRRGTGPSADPLAVLSGALSERWERFVREAARSRRRPTEPALHDLRVAIRRLLAVMAVVDGVLPGGHFRRASGQLRRHLKAFNVLRDIHVQLLAVRKLRRRFPVLVRYEGFLRREESAMGSAVRAELRSIRQDSLLRSCADAEGALSSLYGGLAGSRAVGAMLEGLAAVSFGRVLARRVALTPLDARPVHRLRVAFKKFRYTIEICRPFLSWAGGDHARAMGEFQTAMGEIQDLEVLVAGLRRFVRRKFRPAGTQLLPVFQFLASARAAKLEVFLRSAGRLERFWR